MKTILLTVVMTVYAAFRLAAMPTEAELEREEPAVERLLASEQAALASGKMTRSEVAAKAMQLADEADTEAAKLLLMKGAFVLYVRDGNVEKAAETMNALESAIADLPPECVENMVELALLGVSKKEDGARLRQLLGEAKNVVPGGMKNYEGKENVNDYTWSYRVNNAEAEIVLEKDGGFSCAVSPSPKGRIVIPSTLGGVKVTRIGRNAFRQCKELTAVTIPEGVTDIGHDAFFECVGLMSVAIPQSIKRIDTGAFIACHVLKSVTLPSGITSIGDYAFWDCFALTSVTIPAKSVGGHAFGVCKSLTSVTLSPKVEDIGSDAFCWCGALKEFDVDPNNKKFTSIDGVLYTKDRKELVVCPGGLESVTVSACLSKVWETAFIGCSNLKQINVEADNQKYTSVDGVLYTKDMLTLVACPGGITTLTIPFGVTSIGSTAFSRNTELTSLTMPLSLTNGLGYHAFCACEKIKSLTIPGSIGWGAFDVAKIESVNILSTAKRIEDCAFLNCSRLHSATIEEGVEFIGASSFAGCSSLKSLTVPSSVSTIGDNAFGGCWRMTTVTICGERPAAGKDVFNNCPNVAVIHVPANEMSWAGMKEWQGIPLVFDAKADGVASDRQAQIAEEKAQREAEREEQRRQLLAIQEELRRARKEKAASSSVVEQSESATERTRKAVAKLFPGWSLDTEVFNHDFAGLQASHRGQNNVVFVHPKDQNTPAILSRTVALSDKNPCLFLKVASGAQDGDFVLSVRVNGKDALPERIVCTPDSAPWEDVVVPLSDWRGNAVKIEIVVKANGWWYEFPYFARIEIAEGNGGERFVEGKTTIDGYTWSYRAQNGEATIVAVKDGKTTCVVSPKPKGAVIIPSTLGDAKVTSIEDADHEGGGAFENCGGLTSITIPEGVTNIGDRAFCGCSELKSATIPSTVTIIGNSTFAWCKALPSMTIPSGVTIIRPNAFYGCFGIKLTIPPNVRNIADGMFSHCRGLESLAIPEAVTNIGTGAFWDCSGLKAVTIPAAVQYVGRCAFNECKELGSVTMLGERPDTGNDVFKNCANLKEIHVPANAKSWKGMKEWQGMPLVFDDKAVVNGYTWSYCVRNGEAEIVVEEDGKFSCAVSPSPKGDVAIPSTLGGKSVTRIGQSAFKGCSGMSSVTIPSDVKSIGPWAFEGCSGLTSMAIPDGVKTIEVCTFWGCDGLKSVVIPHSVTTISDAAFGCCGGLTSVTIPPAVKELRTQVFFGCRALESVTIPASVEKIGWAAFVYSGELKEINVEPGNQRFASVDGVLYTKDMTELVACPNALTSLTIPPSVKKLRDAAIISCGKLESLTIPEGVTDIGWQAIKDCGSLKTVTIPSTVRSIAGIAFCNCGSLTSVTMCGERPEAPDDVFAECGKLKAIHVPANAKSWAGMEEWQGVPLVFDAKAK